MPLSAVQSSVMLVVVAAVSPKPDGTGGLGGPGGGWGGHSVDALVLAQSPQSSQ